jgi:hypothetical protein
MWQVKDANLNVSPSRSEVNVALLFFLAAVMPRGSSRFKEASPDCASGVLSRNWRVVGKFAVWLERVGEGGTEPVSDMSEGAR